MLRRFATIESSVRACSTGSLAPLSPSQRWAAYLRLAAVRLEKWVYLIAEARTTRRTWEEQVNALPDDVALVWHAWMIAAPRRYEDDVRRVWWDSLTEYGSAAGREAPLRGFPLILLVRVPRASCLLSLPDVKILRLDVSLRPEQDRPSKKASSCGFARPDSPGMGFKRCSTPSLSYDTSVLHARPSSRPVRLPSNRAKLSRTDAVRVQLRSPPKGQGSAIWAFRPCAQTRRVFTVAIHRRASRGRRSG